jgi:purine-binding chemotaxis protein CheW
MANQADSRNTGNRTMELATFYVGDSLCGMDILKVQEINKLLEMTKVPLAPEYVKGILNLRGQIVTVIDLVTNSVWQIQRYPAKQKHNSKLKW